MHFKGKNTAKLVLFSVVFSSLAGCSKSSFETQFSFEQSSPDIRFESFHADGSIEKSEIVTDPLRDQYPTGSWDELKSSDFRTNAVRSTGTSVNRVNFVFVGDGYTKNELTNYTRDVSANIAKVVNGQPFKAYKNYLAFHQVDVVSAQSGVSIAGSVTKNTALGMVYGCGGVDRLLCVTLNKATAAAKKAPKVDLIFAIANSDRYGGAGYMSPAVATLGARNPSSMEVALHELGHSFGKLTDEYDYAGTTVDCSTFANTSLVDRLQIQAKKSKWFRWLDLSHIGSFQGSCYTTKHFRPTQDSKMRTLNRPFEEVNTEQLIFKIYEKVRPIEFATPAGTLTEHKLLQVTPMVQLENPLEIIWSVNGVAIENLKGLTQIHTSDLGLSSGNHKISVKVTDRTTRVRDEDLRQKLMTQSLTWNLNLSRK